MIDPEECQAQGELLLRASSRSQVRQVRYHLHALGKEYENGARDYWEALEDDPDAEVVIELAGVITVGMYVWLHNQGWHRVKRVLRRGGLSLHCVNEHTNRDEYLNPMSSNSPLVVLS